MGQRTPIGHQRREPGDQTALRQRVESRAQRDEVETGAGRDHVHRHWHGAFGPARMGEGRCTGGLKGDGVSVVPAGAVDACRQHGGQHRVAGEGLVAEAVETEGQRLRAVDLAAAEAMLGVGGEPGVLAFHAAASAVGWSRSATDWRCAAFETSRAVK